MSVLDFAYDRYLLAAYREALTKWTMAPGAPLYVKLTVREAVLHPYVYASYMAQGARQTDPNAEPVSVAAAWDLPDPVRRLTAPQLDQWARGLIDWVVPRAVHGAYAHEASEFLRRDGQLWPDPHGQETIDVWSRAVDEQKRRYTSALESAIISGSQLPDARPFPVLPDLL